MPMTVKEIWEIIVEYCIATDDELGLVTDLMGYNKETLNAVIYSRTGYRDIEQFLEEYLEREV